MNAEKFWSLIDEARQKSGGDTEKQHELMIDALSYLAVEDILEFDRIFWMMMARSYRADLWEAVYLTACGCGDDAFDDFRNWLIAQGQILFEKVLDNPENLADIVDKKQRLSTFDSQMSSIAAVAYKRKTNRSIPETGYQEDLILIGAPLIPEDERPAKFPRIMAKLGPCDEDELLGLYKLGEI